MDDPRWLRLIAVGLVLAALAVGYFLLTGRFTSTRQAGRSVPTPVPTIIPSETSSSQTQPFNILGQDTQATPSTATSLNNGVSTLPRTGNLQVFLGIIAVGIMISGLGLRKYPH